MRLKGEIKSPPFSHEARHEAGLLLRRVQDGKSLSLPLSRPMPSIGPRCHELRVRDRDHNWRILYRVDPEVIVILDIFSKKTERTPDQVIRNCRERLRRYDATEREGD